MISHGIGKKTRFLYAHPLKEVFRKRKIPLWCLRNFTGVSEPKLSRYLNNIDRMPLNLERKLYELIDILNGDLSSLNKKWMNLQESDEAAPNNMLEKDNKE